MQRQPLEVKRKGTAIITINKIILKFTIENKNHSKQTLSAIRSFHAELLNKHKSYKL